MNPRALLGIEAKIWAAAYGAAFGYGFNMQYCIEKATRAVEDFRAKFPEDL